MREERLYSTGEAAKLLGISFITIKRWIYAGRINAIKMPTKRYRDGARHVPADCWQMQPMAEELVAPAKLSVEPEKIPVQAGVQFDTEF